MSDSCLEVDLNIAVGCMNYNQSFIVYTILEVHDVTYLSELDNIVF